MKKENIFLPCLLTITIVISFFILQSKQIIVHGQVDQGTDCNCPSSTYFNETACVAGTLSCPNNISDTVCGCDSFTYLNSCIARANGIKKFTKGDCGTVSNLSCTSSAQCPIATCPSGKTYTKFTCSPVVGSTTNKCTLIQFSADPCPIVSSSGGTVCQGVLSKCSCKKKCLAFTDGSPPPDDCNKTCTPDETSSYVPECKFVNGICTDVQGDDCKCPEKKFFDGMTCTLGTLDCLGVVLDPVCGCDNVTYTNSCVARASGVKSFTKGKCNSVVIANCASDNDCAFGICPNGKIYKRQTCINEQCVEIALSSDPCIESSSSSSSGNILSSSGGIVLDEGFKGVWKVTFSRCAHYSSSSGSSSSGAISSSGNCISCPNVNVTCRRPGIFVPQSCNQCAHCDDCKNATIAFALCVKDNELQGIVNHSRYLDRSTIKSQKLVSNNQVIATLSNTQFLSPQQGITDSPVNLKLRLLDKKRLIGVFDNKFYLEKVRAKKISANGCFLANFPNKCCNGFISSSLEKSCLKGFASSPCLLAGKPLINACCPTSSSCTIPCGSICCNLNETCVSPDLCNKGNPFCFAPASLICQNCTFQGSCVNDKPCPDGTECSRSPDFLCYPIGCPQIKI